MTVRRPLIMDAAGKLRVLPNGDTLPATLIPDIYFPAAYTGRLDVSDYVFALTAPVGFTLPAGMPNSVARVKTAPTGTAVLTILHNGSAIGTLTFNSGVTTGVFHLAANASVAIGDLLEILAPSLFDATLADLRLTLAAVQTS